MIMRLNPRRPVVPGLQAWRHSYIGLQGEVFRMKEKHVIGQRRDILARMGFCDLLGDRVYKTEPVMCCGSVAKYLALPVMHVSFQQGLTPCTLAPAIMVVGNDRKVVAQGHVVSLL